MTATQLMADLARLGIRLEARSDRLRYAPRSAVTPDLADRMKAHKTELLEMLRIEADVPSFDPTDATSVWQTAVDRLEGDPLFPTDTMEALRAADAHWADDSEAEQARESIEVIDPPDSCSKCGYLELWWNVLGDSRCMKCDPPHPRAGKFRKLVARLKTVSAR